MNKVILKTIYAVNLLLVISNIALSDESVQITIKTSEINNRVPRSVYGQGLLDSIATDKFAAGTDFQNTVRNSCAGSLRWPNAGHSNLPVFHFDNKLTRIDSGKTEEAKWNSWDPLHDQSKNLPRNQTILLRTFVQTLKYTKADPLMLFTWRSGEYWAVGKNNEKVPFRDPDPRRMDGTPMSKSEADKLTSRQMQLLENRLMLKEYFDHGGPDNPIIQIGGEIFLYWQVKPWEHKETNPKGLDQMGWMADTLGLYIDDLLNYAKKNSHSVRFACQFKEAKSGGRRIVATSKEGKLSWRPKNFQDDLKTIIQTLDRRLSFVTCSMHYRRTWERWLNEPRMIFGFLVDDGNATLKEARLYVQKMAKELGYPEIDLIPHANSIGCGSEITNSDPVSAPPWQTGLMAAQYTMDLIDAGFQYSHGFPGFEGNNNPMKNNPHFTSLNKQGKMATGPMYHTLRLIGEVLHMSGTAMTDELLCLNNDGKTIVMALRPSPGKGLYLFLLNKRDKPVQAKVSFDKPVKSLHQIHRYSKDEPTAPQVKNTASVVKGFNSGTKELSINIPAYSFMRINLGI